MRRQTINRIIFYITGLLILAMGLTLNTKAGLGVSPIISVSYSISQIMGMNFGNTTMGLYCVFVVVELILHFIRDRRSEKTEGAVLEHANRMNRKLVFLMDVLQIPLSMIFTRFLNLFAKVIPDCVNKVGVDLNTASAPLLAYISGISSAIAKNIVAYREENGKFADRRELLKVPKLGPKAYEQCAGFMRIQGGKNPLDATAVHPESYEAAEKLLKKQGYKAEDITNHKLTGLSLTLRDYKKLAEELEIGEITLRDIVKELEKPARDPRDEMPKPILRTDVLEMKDLKEGMVLKGTVRNVIDFGAFVDIGVHQDGLVHISQITDKFIKHPLEAVSVGDIVDVKVMSVDMKKKRIQLTMRGI